MPSAHTMLLFAVASAALVAIPGPAVLYIVTRGVVHGRRGGLVSMLGVEAGNYAEVLAATVGLAAIVASSAAAFTAVKYIGAAYLIWLGIRAFREGVGAVAAAAAPQRSERRLFWEGFAVGALNPKLAIFLLAFLPQFIAADVGPIWLQTLVLGTIFSLVATAGDTLFALLAGGAGDRLRQRLARPGRLSWLAGTIYIGLGVGAAVTDSGSRG